MEVTQAMLRLELVGSEGKFRFSTPINSNLPATIISNSTIRVLIHGSKESASKL